MLLYSDDFTTRDAVRAAVGRRPATDVEVVRWHECATADAVISSVESERFDILVLDGEAAKVGGLGPGPPAEERDLRLPPDHRAHRSPAGRWLAAWSQADLAVPHPLDPIALTSAVATLARSGVPRRPDAWRRDASDLARRCSPTLIAGRDLDRPTAEWAMDQIMSGEATPLADRRASSSALRAKGESVEEMRGLAEQMLAHARRIEVPGPSLDIVGTGGDRAHTVNISTMAAMVAAAAGVRVVKHGNRAASSSSGSADVLEALGIDLSLPPERVVAVAQEAGITFCFAQTFHPSFRHAGGAAPGARRRRRRSTSSAR